MANCHSCTGGNIFGFYGKGIEIEMDFDFIDPAVPENKQAAPLSINGKKEKKGLKKMHPHF